MSSATNALFTYTCSLIFLIAAAPVGAHAQTPPSPTDKANSRSVNLKDRGSPPRIIGLYVGGGGTKHPYSSQAWTLDDWRKYYDGLKKLGYNTILIHSWAELMHDPPSDDERAALDHVAKRVDMLHDEFGMRIYSALCPNLAPGDKGPTGIRVNPADKEAVHKMMELRERLFSRIAKLDGFFVIDSDPGSYPGSTNAEFVYLIGEHRMMFDRLRPGIELYYWQHFGWAAYGRFYATGKVALGTDEEFQDTIRRLRDLNPEPWGVTRGRVWDGKKGIDFLRKLGVRSRALDYQYARIEPEPDFPIVRFGTTEAHKAGGAPMARGVMGNVCNPLVQLPNIFAFARGAQRLPATKKNYRQFADDLIPGHGEEILGAWEAAASTNPVTMWTKADEMDRLARSNLPAGPLQGLMLGDPRRFVADLAFQLRVKAATEDLYAAEEQHQDLREPLRNLATALETWLERHGYQNPWSEPRFIEALQKLHSPVVNVAMDMTPEGSTPEERIQKNYSRLVGYMSRVVQALKDTEKNITIPEK